MAEGDAFLVLASDGVWEFMDNQEVGFRTKAQQRYNTLLGDEVSLHVCFRTWERWSVWLASQYNYRAFACHLFPIAFHPSGSGLGGRPVYLLSTVWALAPWEEVLLQMLVTSTTEPNFRLRLHCTERRKSSCACPTGCGNRAKKHF